MSSVIRYASDAIASRICHDLAGPISAISNGLELLQLCGGDSLDGPEGELVVSGIANLTAQLNLCRLAFGAAYGDQLMSTDHIRDTLTTLYGQAGVGRQIHFSWDFSAANTSRQVAKQLLLGFLCAETALTRGGAMRIATTADDWMILAEGNVSADHPGWRILEPTVNAGTVSATDCQFYALNLASQATGHRLLVTREANAIAINARAG